VSKLGLISVFIVCFGYTYAQDNLLKRKVRLEATQQPLADVLVDLSNQADFTFSYDASIFSGNETVSLASNDESVKLILDHILDKQVEYKVSGNHLILLRKPAVKKKEKYHIAGQVLNQNGKQPLSEIVVYEVSSLVSSVTDTNGNFSMQVPAEFEQLGISFSQKAVRDTVILLKPEDQKLNILLETMELPDSLHSIPLQNISPVESVPFVRQIVAAPSLQRTEKINLVRQRIGQISFIPKWGTNLKMSGTIENKVSVNVLIGYNYGVTILEVGGIFNVIRNNVTGVQGAGVGNLVGGDTKGLQMGGVFNHNRGSFVGLQAAGINNNLLGSLDGAQVAGVNNIVKGEMKGGQIAGVNNLATKDVNGVQIAGFSNLTLADVKSIQIAGVFNNGESVKGLQLAGAVNIAKDDMRGVQIAGAVNKSKNVNALQFGGLGNIATGTVSGVQFASLFNYAKHVTGTQMAAFNIADSASGTPIGFLSFVRKGYRKLEISTNEILPANISFKTGVDRFYNIISAGYGSWNGKKRWSFGYGFGTEKKLSEKYFSNIELVGHWINEEEFQEDLSLLNQVTVTFGKRKAKGLEFTIGPTFNLWLSEWKDPDTGEFLTELAPYTISSEEVGSILMQFWVGGKLAVQF